MKHFLLFMYCVVLLSCQPNTKSKLDDTYKSEMQDYWLKNSENRIYYLQLTGLFKLDSLENTFGKDSNNNVVLNIDALPPKIGTISVLNNGITFSSAENIAIKTQNDSLVKLMSLKLNEYGSSIKLFHEQLNWQVITRSKQHYLRVWDTKNPAIVAFKGFEHYELNSDFIIEGQFTYYKKAKSEIVKAEVDGKRSTSFIGKITFEVNGENHDLDVGEGGFTMVSDETTGDTTYGGGRYIYLDLPKTDGSVNIDFNRLYNPPCAFSEFTTCLYPPRQNVLPFKILAGEKINFNNFNNNNQ